MNKIYVVTTQAQIDYDFSVTTIKHGAFVDPQNALNRLIKVVEAFKTEHEDAFAVYSNAENYRDEESGALAIVENFENGYWCCSFGFQDKHECYQICIDEFDIEDDLITAKGKEEADVECGILTLEVADLLEFDQDTYNIKVDKQIFDGYVPNTCIDLKLEGTGTPNAILTYIMVDEDEDGITMHYLVE